MAISPNRHLFVSVVSELQLINIDNVRTTC